MFITRKCTSDLSKQQGLVAFPHQDDLNEVLLAPALVRCIVDPHECRFEFNVFIPEKCFVFLYECLKADNMHHVVILPPCHNGSGKHVVHINIY